MFFKEQYNSLKYNKCNSFYRYIDRIMSYTNFFLVLTSQIKDVVPHCCEVILRLNKPAKKLIKAKISITKWYSSYVWHQKMKKKSDNRQKKNKP